MKNHLKKLMFVVSCLGFIFSGCEKDLYENQIKETEQGKISFVSIKDVPFLIPTVEKFNPAYKYLSHPNENVANRSIADLNLDLDNIKVYLKENGISTYSIVIKNDFSEKNDYYFENLHILKIGDNYECFISKYNSTDDNEKFDIDNYTGTIEISDLESDLKGTMEFVNGLKVNIMAPEQPTEGEIGSGQTPLARWPKWLLELFGYWNGNPWGSSEGSSSSSGGSNHTGYTISVTTVSVGQSSGPPSGNNSSSSGSGSNTIIDYSIITPNNPMWNTNFAQSTKAFLITNRLNLGGVVLAWLMQTNNATITSQIFGFLANAYMEQESYNDPVANAFASELINIAMSETNQTDVNNLVGLSLAIQSHGNNPLDDAFMASVDQYIDASMFDPIVVQMINAHYTAQCAILRYNHQNWPEWRVRLEASKDLVHIIFDALGLIPVYGEVADLANGVLYAIDGDGANATLSLASAVPIAGWASFSTKYGLKVINVVNDVNTKVRLTWKITNGIVSFGAESTCRAQLRKILGLAVGNPLIAHHIMPISLQTEVVIQKAAKSGSAFHLNEALNGLALNALQHTGNHAVYTDKIFLKLQDFKELNPNATPLQCYNYVTLLINQIKAWIIAHPNTNINLIVLP